MTTMSAIHPTITPSFQARTEHVRNTNFYIELVSSYINDDCSTKEQNWETSKTELIEAFTYLHSNKSRRLRDVFKNLFVAIPPDRLDSFLQDIVYKSIFEKKPEMHSYALSLVSFEQLENILQSKDDSFDEELNSIKELAEIVAKYYREPPGSKAKKSFFLEIRRMFSFVFNFIPNVINTFMIAFSLYDIGKDPQSAWEASALLDVYYKFIMIPAAIVVVLNCILPPLGLTIYAIAASIVLVAIVALVIYIKWIRPCPNRLPHCTNLTEDAKLGRVAPVVGREHEIDRLVNLFSNLDSSLSRHAILVGPSGVGKTEIIKGLAQKISRGKDIPKSLRKKKIFVINTASLVQGGMYGYADQLTYLINRVKGFENEVIFFFDEIQAAFKNKKPFSDFLKPILDRGKIHCVAATTTNEYNKYLLRDPAFARRFERINVTEMGDDDIKEVLQVLIRDSEDGALIDDIALDSIIAKTNQVKNEIVAKKGGTEYQQPAFAVQVLTHAIKKVSTTSDSHNTPPALVEKKARLTSLRTSMNRNPQFRPTTPEGKRMLVEMRNLEKEIQSYKDSLSSKKKAIAYFKEKFADLQKMQLQLKKVAATALKDKRKTKRLKSFFWEYEYVIPQTKKAIDALKEVINDDYHKIAVDDALIDEVIREIQENEKQITQSNDQNTTA
ncbi:MAG: AAA family ATPase [Chlamydiota bacterium]|nr:AAA family ATPase [Chlamydiota bacterium]